MLLYLTAREALALACQQPDDIDISVRLTKQCCIQLLELIAQVAAAPEHQHINVLRQAEIGSQEAEIVGCATKDHVALQDLVVIPLKAVVGKVFLALAQIERTQVDAVCDAVVQAALVVLQLVLHPAGGTPAGYEHDVIAPLRPAGPEVLKLVDELTAVGVYPRHLVEEHHLAPVATSFKECRELQECLVP